jgi:hypothetical protein
VLVALETKHWALEEAHNAQAEPRERSTSMLFTVLIRLNACWHLTKEVGLLAAVACSQEISWTTPADMIEEDGTARDEGSRDTKSLEGRKRETLTAEARARRSTASGESDRHEQEGTGEENH